MHEKLMKVVRVGGVVIYYDTLWAADQVIEIRLLIRLLRIHPAIHPAIMCSPGYYVFIRLLRIHPAMITQINTHEPSPTIHPAINYVFIRLLLRADQHARALPDDASGY